MSADEIVFFSLEELLELAKEIEPTSAIDAGKIDFLVSKIRSKRLGANKEKNVAEIAAIVWYDLTTLHPLTDGNKRLSSEAVQRFLKLNGYEINTILNGFVLVSLRLASNEMTEKELAKWIKEKMVKA